MSHTALLVRYRDIKQDLKFHRKTYQGRSIKFLLQGKYQRAIVKRNAATSFSFFSGGQNVQPEDALKTVSSHSLIL